MKEHSKTKEQLINELEEMKTRFRNLESEKVYRGLYEESRDGYALVNMDGTIIESNTSFKEMLGYTDEELLTKTYEDITPSKWHQVEAKILDEQVKTRGYSDIYEKEYIRKNGEVFPIEIRTSLVRGEDGKPKAMWAFVKDITERRLAETKLNASEERLRLALAAANQGLYDLNVQTGDAIVNSQYALMLGYDPETFMETNQRWIERLHPDDKESVSSAYKAYVTGEIPEYRVEFRQKTRTGDWKWILSLGKIIERDSQGRPLRMLGTHTDISDRKRAEEEIVLNASRLQSLINILQHKCETVQDFIDYALDEAIKLTASKIGYIYYYDEERREFTLNTWSKDVMKECTITKPKTCYELDKTGIWGETVRQRKEIIINDFLAEHPLKKGYPEGHAKLYKYMTVPVFSGDKIIAVIGLANKATDYSETDVLQIKLLMNNVWKVVDERKALEALRASEERYSSIISSSMDGIFDWDMATGTAYLSERWLEIHGLPLNAKVSFDEFNEFIHPEDAACVAQSIRDHLAERTQMSKCEYRIRDARGEEKWISSRGKASFDSQGRAYRMVGMVTDITVRKKIEKALQESEEHYRQLFNLESDAIIVIDVETLSHLDVNKSAEHMYGYTREELLQLKSTDLSAEPEETKARVKQDDEDYVHIPLRWHRKKDGTIFPVDITARFFYLKGRRTLIVAMRDITDRMRAEEKIRRNADELAVLNSLGRQASSSLSLDKVLSSTCEEMLKAVHSDMVFIFFREGEALNLKYLLPASAGERLGEVPEHRVGDCICGLTIRDGRPLYSSNIFTDPRCTFEECKRAGVRSFAALPLRNGDEIIGVIGLASDVERDFKLQDEFLNTIADQVSLSLSNALLHEQVKRHSAELEERVIKRTVELQSANRELEAFAYSVSHDLRAPLRAIEGFSRIVVDEYNDKFDDEGRRLLNVIRTNIKKMDQLIMELLELSRVGRTEIRNSRIDMTRLVHSIFTETVSPEVQQKFIFSVGQLPVCFGDLTLIRQLWGNLISNSIKYTLPKEDRRIEISGRVKDGMNVYCIKDSGVGFNPDYSHKLFGVFQRLHKDSEFKGTGVGLSIVQRIVIRHGGKVWAEGKENEGAAFWFSIPVKEE
jgi:PAS domain S-box-containing protein